MTFCDLPIEIQVFILRDYDKCLWTISRSLNKTLRNATEMEFLKNEFQYPISDYEFDTYIKTKPEFIAVFSHYQCSDIIGYRSNLCSRNSNYERNESYSHREQKNGDIFFRLRSIGNYGLKAFVSTDSILNYDLLTIYNILSNRYSKELAVSAIIDKFEIITSNYNKNDTFHLSKFNIWLRIHCKIFKIEFPSNLEYNIGDHMCNKHDELFIEDELKIPEYSIPKLKNYLLNISDCDKYKFIKFNIPWCY